MALPAVGGFQSNRTGSGQLQPAELDVDRNHVRGENGQVKEVLFRTKARLSPALEEELFSKPQFEPREPNTMPLSVVWSVLPIIVIAALIWFFFIRQIKMAGKGALSFGKSKARLLAKERNKTTFKDV